MPYHTSIYWKSVQQQLTDYSKETGLEYIFVVRLHLIDIQADTKLVAILPGFHEALYKN